MTADTNLVNQPSERFEKEIKRFPSPLGTFSKYSAAAPSAAPPEVAAAKQ